MRRGGAIPLLISLAVPCGLDARASTDDDCQRARAALKAGELAAALDAYRQAMGAAPRSPCGYLGASDVCSRLGDLEEAAAILKGGLAELPDSRSLRLALAALLVDLREFDTAADHYERLLAGPEESVPALVGLGILHSTQGDLERAAAAFRRALAAEPRSLAARYNLALAESRRGDVPAALEELRRALEIDDANAMVHYARAGCLEKEGRLEEARAALLRALEIDPALAPAHYRLGNVSLRLGLASDGRAALRRFRQLKARTHYQRGDVLQRRGDRRGAIRAFERSLDAYPELVDAHARLGRLYLEERDGGRALLHARRAAQLDPTGARLSNVAWVYFRVGDREKALEWIDRALEIEPGRKEFLELRRQVTRAAPE